MVIIEEQIKNLENHKEGYSKINFKLLKRNVVQTVINLKDFTFQQMTEICILNKKKREPKCKDKVAEK
jgi:hypothetical protein